jgi:hypothetical protein
MLDKIREHEKRCQPWNRNIRSGIGGVLAGLAMGIGIGYGIRGDKTAEPKIESGDVERKKMNHDYMFPQGAAGNVQGECLRLVEGGGVVSSAVVEEMKRAIAERERAKVAQAIIDRYCIRNDQDAERIRKAIGGSDFGLGYADRFKIKPVDGKFGLVYEIKIHDLPQVVILDQEPRCDVDDKIIDEMKKEREKFAKAQRKKQMIENREFDKLAAEIADVERLKEEIRSIGHGVEGVDDLIRFLDHLPDEIRRIGEGDRCGLVEEYQKLKSSLDVEGNAQSAFLENKEVAEVMVGVENFLVDYVKDGGGWARREIERTAEGFEFPEKWIVSEIKCAGKGDSMKDHE